jgi:hypothetical protein
MVMSPIPWRTRHNYLCRPQKVFSESITRSQDVFDLWLGCAFLLAKLDCLVYGRIELLAWTANPLNAHSIQHPQESLIPKSDSFCPRVIAQVLGRVDKSAVKIIDRRKQLAEHFVARALAVLGSFAVNPTLVIEEVGALPLELRDAFVLILAVLRHQRLRASLPGCMSRSRAPRFGTGTGTATDYRFVRHYFDLRCLVVLPELRIQGPEY